MPCSVALFSVKGTRSAVRDATDDERAGCFVCAGTSLADLRGGKARLREFRDVEEVGFTQRVIALLVARVECGQSMVTSRCEAARLSSANPKLTVNLGKRPCVLPAGLHEARMLSVLFAASSE